MFKKREKEGRVKHMELTENRTEEVGVFTRFIRGELGGSHGQ